MNSQTQSLGLLDNLRGLARRVSPRTLLTRVAGAAAAGLREVWEIVNAATNLRNELRRMADECETTQPEHAARLRKVASANWGE